MITTCAHATGAVLTVDLTCPTCRAEFGALVDYDPVSDTSIEPDAVICQSHRAVDYDPRSGRCWYCGARP